MGAVVQDWILGEEEEDRPKHRQIFSTALHSVADPDPGLGESQHPDPGSGMNNPNHILEYVSVIFSNVESFAHKALVAFNCGLRFNGSITFICLQSIE